MRSETAVQHRNIRNVRDILRPAGQNSVIPEHPLTVDAEQSKFVLMSCPSKTATF